MAKNISRQINLLERYNDKQRRKKKESGKKQSMAIYMVLTSLVLAAGMGCAYFYCDSEREKADTELSRVQDTLLDGDLRDKQLKALRYAGMNSSLSEQLEAFDAVNNSINSSFSDYSFLVSNLYERLEKLCGSDIGIIYYSLEGNVLTLSVVPTRPNVIADFVIRAEESGLFSKINYNGFSSSKDEDGNEQYLFIIECVF